MVTDPSNSEAEAKFLLHLYKYQPNRFEFWSNYAIDAELPIPEVVKLHNRLASRGLVTRGPVGDGSSITPLGIDFVERGDLLSAHELTETNSRRVRLLAAVDQVGTADLDVNHGNSALTAQTGLDRNELYALFSLLEAQELVVQGSVGYSLTPKGCLRLERRLAWERFVELHELKKPMTPQKRGHALEELLQEVAVQEEWIATRNSKPRAEENDVVISRDRELWLISSKWETKRIGPTALSDLIAKLGRRPSGRGLLCSMSGFTSGVVSLAAEGNTLILFAGPEDISKLIRGDLSFERMLTEKYRARVEHRRVVFA